MKVISWLLNYFSFKNMNTAIKFLSSSLKYRKVTKTQDDLKLIPYIPLKSQMIVQLNLNSMPKLSHELVSRTGMPTLLKLSGYGSSEGSAGPDNTIQWAGQESNPQLGFRHKVEIKM